MSEIKIPFYIEFANTVEALIAWQKFILKNNINNSKVKLAVVSFLPAIASLIFSFIFVMVSGNGGDLSAVFIIATITSFIIFVIACIFFVIPLYFVLRWSIFLKSKTIFKNSRGSLQSKEMNFYENSINIVDSEIYAVFNNFYEDNDYLFLTLTKMQAAIIPKKHLTVEQLEFIKNKLTQTIKS